MPGRLAYGWLSFLWLILALLELPVASASGDGPLQATEARRQAPAVEGLLRRLLPQHAHLFTVRIAPPDGTVDGSTSPPPAFFRVTCDGARLSVDASSGVEAAAGVHWLLKERCGASLSWAATGGARIPASECFSAEGLRRLAELGPLQRTRVVPIQYYMNACTHRCDVHADNLLVPGKRMADKRLAALMSTVLS